MESAVFEDITSDVSYRPDKGGLTDYITTTFLQTDPPSPLCDATLTCSDGVRVAVARNLLALRSPFFHTLFFSSFKEAGDAASDVPITSVTLQQLLTYIYSDDVPVVQDALAQLQTSPAHEQKAYLHTQLYALVDLAVAADFVQIPRLCHICAATIRVMFDKAPFMACAILSICHSHGEGALSSLNLPKLRTIVFTNLRLYFSSYRDENCDSTTGEEEVPRSRTPSDSGTNESAVASDAVSDNGNIHGTLSDGESIGPENTQGDDTVHESSDARNRESSNEEDQNPNRSINHRQGKGTKKSMEDAGNLEYVMDLSKEALYALFDHGIPENNDHMQVMLQALLKWTDTEDNQSTLRLEFAKELASRIDLSQCSTTFLLDLDDFKGILSPATVNEAVRNRLRQTHREKERFQEMCNVLHADTTGSLSKLSHTVKSALGQVADEKGELNDFLYIQKDGKNIPSVNGIWVLENLTLIDEAVNRTRDVVGRYTRDSASD